MSKGYKKLNNQLRELHQYTENKPRKEDYLDALSQLNRDELAIVWKLAMPVPKEKLKDQNNG